MQDHKKVIPFPQGWRFLDYIEGSNNPIEEWYQGLSEDEGRPVLDAIIKANKKADHPSQWVNSKMLQGEAKEHAIWEWRFVADGRQQRLLGIFGSERKQAIFLIGCSHKQNVYDPPRCIETAIKRAKDVRAERARINERKVREDI